MTRRIVVVGHSAITCLGLDIDETWRGLVESRSGLRRRESFGLDMFLQNIVGRVEDLEQAPGVQDSAAGKLKVRSIHLALASARAAWTDAGLSGLPLDPDRIALIIGSAIGGLDLYQSESERAKGRKNLASSPYLIPGLIINQSIGQIAQDLGLYGPSFAPSNACATGGHSVALAASLLRSGEADLALCGSGESVFSPLIVNSFATMKALFTKKPGDRSESNPAMASRPFSVDRGGFLMSEGAGMLVLATEAEARRLGLRPQAEVIGWATNTDGYHMAMPHAGRVARCLEVAIERSGIHPEQIDYYNAHGTSTVVNDRVETQAVKQVFGDHARNLPVSSIKGALGHSLGAASSIEAAVCVRALREQMIPPTLHYEPDPELDLDFVPHQARSARLDTVMTASFGFGGTNNALVLRRWSDA